MGVSVPKDCIGVLGPNEHVIPRNYTPTIHVFGLDDRQRGKVEEHFRKSLETLAEDRPEFTCTIRYATQGPRNRAISRSKGSAEIELAPSVTSDKWTFESLKDQGFPQGLLDDLELYERKIAANIELGGPLPVCWVRLIFIKGGLLLEMAAHHITMAGEMRSNFVDALANATCGTANPRENLSFTLPDGLMRDVEREVRKNDFRFRQLLGKCPEWISLRRKNGPTQPEDDAYQPSPRVKAEFIETRIFKISTERLGELQEELALSSKLRTKPSKTAVICGVFWAHITKARMAHELNGKTPEREGILTSPVNWRKCKDIIEEMQTFAGSTVLLAENSIALRELVSAAEPKAPGHESSLAAAVEAASACFKSVNRPYVVARLATIQASDDPKEIGVRHHPDRPTDFVFNDWRKFGMNKAWKLHGDQEKPVSACAMRRARKKPGVACMVLPGSQECPHYEVMVGLRQGSLKSLVEDAHFQTYLST